MKGLKSLFLAVVILISSVGINVSAEENTIDITVKSGMIGNIFFDEASFDFDVLVTNNYDSCEDINAEYSLYSIGTDMERADCIAKYSGEYTVSGNDEICIPVSVPVNKYGLYEFEVILKDLSGEVLNSKTVSCSNVVRNTKMTKTVGVNTHLIWYGDADNLLYLVKNAGMGTIRDGFTWNSYEKKPGEYKFSERSSKMLKAAEKYGIDVLGVLSVENSIYDDGSKKSDFLREADVLEYKAYLTSLLNEDLMKNNVSKLEIMNEPASMFDVVEGENVGTDVSGHTKRAESYARMVKATKEIIETEGLDYKTGVLSLTGMTETSSKNFADLAFSKLSEGDFDAVSIHPYVVVSNAPEYNLLKKSAREQANYYKNLANGSVRGNSTRKYYSFNITEPMWHTELGYSSSTGNDSAGMSVGDEYVQAAMVIRLLDEIKHDNPQDLAYIYEMSADGTDITDREDNFEMVRSVYSENPYSAKFLYLAVSNYNSLTMDAYNISRVETGNSYSGGNYITKYETPTADVYLMRTTKDSGATTNYNFGDGELHYYDMLGNKLSETEVKSGNLHKLTTTPYYVVSGEAIKRAEPENDTAMRSGEFVICGRIPSGVEGKKISLTVTDENGVFGDESFEEDAFFWDQGVTGENGAFEFTIKAYDTDTIKAHIVSEDGEMIVLELRISIDENGKIRITSNGIDINNLDFGSIDLGNLSIYANPGEEYSSYKLIAALYKDERVVNMKIFDKNRDSQNTGVIYNAEFEEKNEDCDALKVMLVKDFGTLTPLCEAYVKN